MRPQHSSTIQILSIICVGLLAACTTQPKQAPGSTSAPRTNVSYRTDAPGAEGRHELSPGQSMRLPPPTTDNPLPVYPQRWRTHGLPPLELSVQVSVDELGAVSTLRVGALEPSSACDDCAADFSASLEQAVRDWRFSPLQIVAWVDGPDENGDGMADSVLRDVVETRPYSLRLRFRFEVQDGEVRVTRTSQ